MARINRVYFDSVIRDTPSEPPREMARPEAHAKLIEFLRARSLVTVAGILGPRFSTLVNQIEVRNREMCA